MRLAIIEPTADGHQMILYARWIALQALARGWQVAIVTTPEASSHRATQLVTAQAGPRLAIRTMEDVRGVYRTSVFHLAVQQWRQYGAFRRAFNSLCRDYSADVVCVPYLAHIDKVMAVLGSPFGRTPVVGFLFGVDFHHRDSGISGRPRRNQRVRELLFRRLFHWRELRTLLTVDETLVPYLHRRSSPLVGRVRYVPECAALEGTASREEARRELGLSKAAFVILVYGSIGPSKGVAQLLAGVTDPSCRSGATILLAGRVSDDLESLLATRAAASLRDSGRLVRLPGLLDDEQEWRAFRAADVAWLGYVGSHDMSGVLVQAGSIGLPVIASSEGLIGWMTRRYGLGICVDVMSAPAVAGAIDRIARAPLIGARTPELRAEFAARHAPAHFAALVCDAILAAKEQPAL